MNPLSPDVTWRPAGRYRCRSHLDQPVTFRGTGCHICDNDARNRLTAAGRRAARDAARRKAREELQ